MISKFNLISDLFPAFLLDAYGVFWGGNQAGLLPGAKEAMETLVSQGKIVGILSNSTQLAEKEISKLQAHGLIQGIHFHFFITSGEMIRSVFLREAFPFATPRKKLWLLGEPHPRFSSPHVIFEGSVFQETKYLQDADFIYLSIPHIKGEDQTNPQIFREQLLQIKEVGLPMVCPNPDRFAHEGFPPQAVVRQGSLAAIYEELGGNVFYTGKPYRMAYALAMEVFAEYQITQPEAVLMIGDTPEIDIRGAKQFGMKAALVTQTGMMAERISSHGLNTAIENLPSHDLPDYMIERFAYNGI